MYQLLKELEKLSPVNYVLTSDASVEPLTVDLCKRLFKGIKHR